MTKNEVLQVLIQFFKDVNAVDPNLSDAKIAQTKLPDLDLFQHQLTHDPDFKKEVVYRKMVSELKEAHPNKISPEISPQDETVFDRDITIDTLAAHIAEDTPDQVF